MTVFAETPSTLSLAATIVASFVANNNIAPDDVGRLIRSAKAALDATPLQLQTKPTVQEPAHSLKNLVTPDAVFCAECGKKFKSLKRHLGTDHKLTPQAYRTKWGIKNDSPMVAPNSTAIRSQIAKTTGLGRREQKPAAKIPAERSVKPRTKPHKGPSKAG